MTEAATSWPVHGRISGPIVMIGFGSIGRGTLPLIERHFEYDKARFTVVEPSDAHKALADQHGLRFEQVALTKDNYREILTPLLTEGGGQGFCVNVSVDTYSRAIMELCRELGAFYIGQPLPSHGPASISTSPRARATAPTTPCARTSSTRAPRTPVAPPPSRAVAPIQAWFPGS